MMRLSVLHVHFQILIINILWFNRLFSRVPILIPKLTNIHAYLHTVQPKRNAPTKFSCNQFGMKFWPNLHVNWLQLNLQIGFN